MGWKGSTLKMQCLTSVNGYRHPALTHLYPFVRGNTLVTETAGWKSADGDFILMLNLNNTTLSNLFNFSRPQYFIFKLRTLNYMPSSFMFFLLFSQILLLTSSVISIFFLFCEMENNTNVTASKDYCEDKMRSYYLKFSEIYCLPKM